MLVLTRTTDEKIMIGHDIEITVVSIRGDKVRIGITAPTNISVHRKEVYEQIQQENANLKELFEGTNAPQESKRPPHSPRPPTETV